MQAFESPIIRVNSGQLNTVRDTVPGGVTSGIGGTGGKAKFAGQLGKILAVSQEQIGLMQDTSVGTLFGGAYQYVRLSEDLGTPAPEIGQALFWDPSADPGDFVVNDTDGTTAVPQVAGVYIGGPEAGEYGFIQIAGPVMALFAGALTNAAQTGQGLTVTAAGLFDNATPVNPIYTAYAIGLPAVDVLRKVQLSGFLSFRG